MNAPQKLHWAHVAGDPGLVVKELTTVLKAVVPKASWPDAWGDVVAVLERFEKCHAVDPDDVKPIASDDRLWEMRIEISTYALLIRIYETEVDDLPGHIVALHAHEKVVLPGDAERTKSQQDAAIDLAGQRWDEGRETYWGLP